MKIGYIVELKKENEEHILIAGALEFLLKCNWNGGFGTSKVKSAGERGGERLICDMMQRSLPLDVITHKISVQHQCIYHALHI